MDDLTLPNPEQLQTTPDGKLKVKIADLDLPFSAVFVLMLKAAIAYVLIFCLFVFLAFGLSLVVSAFGAMLTLGAV